LKKKQLKINISNKIKLKKKEPCYRNKQSIKKKVKRTDQFSKIFLNEVEVNYWMKEVMEIEETGI